MQLVDTSTTAALAYSIFL